MPLNLPPSPEALAPACGSGGGGLGRTQVPPSPNNRTLFGLGFGEMTTTCTFKTKFQTYAMVQVKHVGNPARVAELWLPL